MEPIVVIVLIIAIAVVLSSGTHTPTSQPIIIIQQPGYDTTPAGFGCLPIIVIVIILLVLLGALQGV